MKRELDVLLIGYADKTSQRLQSSLQHLGWSVNYSPHLTCTIAGYDVVLVPPDHVDLDNIRIYCKHNRVALVRAAAGCTAAPEILDQQLRRAILTMRVTNRKRDHKCRDC